MPMLAVVGRKLFASWLLVIACLAAALLACLPTAEAAGARAVDFGRDVYPILQRSCFECHGRDREEGELRLDERVKFLKGGASGPSVVSGKPEESELLRRINLPTGDDEIMPARGKRLSAKDVATIRVWITAGAVWPDKLEARKHWAYVAPVRPALPKLTEPNWPRNPIDAFVLARLGDEKLEPSPEADRAALIRRLSLDLIGLPPSPAEVSAFLADKSPQAYGSLVDRLLASPEFGPRWARPWLDLARYADSHGFQRDDLRQLWAYRDWVINALNADMPLDRFTIEQLAGDLLPDATESQRIATGFHRSTTTNVEAGSDPEETRINQVIDRLNTTAYVWLGTTLECAQCHDHKYDPFTQRDYYRLLAFFNNTELEADRSNPKVPGSIRFLGPSLTLADPAVEAEQQRLNGELREMEQAISQRRRELASELPVLEPALAAELKSASAVNVLEIADFDSAGDAAHKVLDDNSVLLVDDAPNVDTYTVVVETRLQDITGFKLEALADPSLPGNGPGRGAEERPNFVLQTFAVTAAPLGKEPLPQPLRLIAGEASFEQKSYSLAGAVDDNPKTGWAIGGKFHQSHWANFQTESPVGFAGGTRLTFTLVQNSGNGRTIGRLRLSALTGKKSAKPIPGDVATILKTQPEARSDKQRDRLAEFCLDQDQAAKDLLARQSKAKLKLAGLQKPTTLVMREMPEPRAMAIFTRGDFRAPGAPVEAGGPAVLHPLPQGPPTRLTLARWLVDRSNPLVARVMVNRWWAELFGHGIVTTVEDFGIKGEPPTHPELLDWLAVELMDNGWSMKRLLRTIVTSATYRQSSKVSAELLARDDQNLLYARGSRFRLDAERIRDNALSLAGLLSLRQGGPPIRPYQPDGLWTKVGGAPLEYVVSPGSEKYRRGIYVVWKRASPYPSFVNFDATARLACTVKRSRSNTPLQALTLLNDPVYVEAAFALADRVVRDQRGPLEDQLRYAFRVCLARAPESFELDVLRKLYSDQLAAAKADPADAKKLAAQGIKPNRQSPEQLAAWYAVAVALLNLDETITKN